MTPHQPSRRAFAAGLTALAGLGSAGAGAAGAAPAAKRPNIVFFLGEDLRNDEFGFAGNKILKTPNMDAIAREGTVFKNAFVTNSLCLPSRASFLTGAYSHTTGATTPRPPAGSPRPRRPAIPGRSTIWATSI
jgi:arylsulfatase A-like enzyme